MEKPSHVVEEYNTTSDVKYLSKSLKGTLSKFEEFCHKYGGEFTIYEGPYKSFDAVCEFKEPLPLSFIDIWSDRIDFDLKVALRLSDEDAKFYQVTEKYYFENGKVLQHRMIDFDEDYHIGVCTNNLVKLEGLEVGFTGKRDTGVRLTLHFERNK